MTEKELLYVEDAIGHEENVIAYLNDTLNDLEDKSLIKFVSEEMKKHEKLRTKLITVLEDSLDE